jgi:hypothetical protein
MLFSQAALRGWTGSFEMSVFQTLSAGNIGQPGAPGTVVPAWPALAGLAVCASVPERAGLVEACPGCSRPACAGSCPGDCAAGLACATGLACACWLAVGTAATPQAASNASGSAAAIAAALAAAGRAARLRWPARSCTRVLCIAEHPGTAARAVSGDPRDIGRSARSRPGYCARMLERVVAAMRDRGRPWFATHAQIAVLAAEQAGP